MRVHKSIFLFLSHCILTFLRVNTIEAAISVGKNHEVLLMMILTPATAASSASGSGRKLMKGLQIKNRFSK